MTYPIRSDVPLPEPARSGGRTPLYPFASMKPGDSFEVPVRAGETVKKLKSRLRSTSVSWAKRNLSALRFAVRVSDDGKSVGVWAQTKGS